MILENRKEVRQREARERQAQRDALGDAGQLQKLERTGHGHTREADRLRARLKAAK